ncbi:phage Gp37/Gp68 family protein [Mesorhizobium sp. B2-8-5]|uniref:phage Gp37/Gp68 family protein n=1 Tax=Mesorhizobium sp. B2-8-5 TaxID=2589903 RepID=UPI00112C7863|nr:phage Gp37/Gp68 family protein [Mesorhizobium sp. B2-8-5]UCI23718.1 phage Gp37/Gp68 family protein [Mesorhizobium sp. B2-8-5]
MADKSPIEWTDATWNPIVGCSILSPGCIHCYAMRMAGRIEAMGGAPHYAGTTKNVNGNTIWTGKLALAPERILTEPLRWQRPRRIFVNSMGDLFHEDVPDAWIDRVFAVMALAPQHTFQVLTKRARRMREYMNERWQPAPAHRLAWQGGDTIDIPAETAGEDREDQVRAACEPFLEKLGLVDTDNDDLWTEDGNAKAMTWTWPLKNVWLGVSAERQQEADERIPELLATPAAIRFVSAEPLLGPIDFYKYLRPLCDRCPPWEVPCRIGCQNCTRLDQIIVGGESGQDARPMHPAWPRSIRDQCAAAGVPFFFKQWGAFRPLTRAEHNQACGATLIGTDPYDQDAHVLKVGKKAAGRLLDGVEHNGMPELREVPAL